MSGTGRRNHRRGPLRKWLGRLPRWIWFIPLVLLAAVLIGFWAFNPRLTAYLEGPSFKAELDKETSKGLHFSGAYSAIQRTGFATGASPYFGASGGVKAIKSVTAEGITGKFNPWGVFLRRWQLEYIHIRTGQAEIQVYTPKPDNKPPKPWYAVLMPDRVYLKEVTCDSADITWHMGKKEAGFYGLRLLITPYGRDFEYRAMDGILKMPSVPDLGLKDIHMVITKEWITLYGVNLTEEPDGKIFAKGKAGLKNDKSLEAEATFEDLPLGAWIPTTGEEKIRGTASGDVSIASPDEKMESSSGHGTVRLHEARVLGLPFLDYVASATRNKDLEHLELNQCSFAFQWTYPRVEVSDLRVEAKGEFRIEGGVVVDGGAIDGKVEFGISDRNLEWLPKAKQQIFTRAKGGYHWTTVRLSGTLKEPKNDLVPRLAETLKSSPDASAGLFFRELGEWFEQKLRKD